MRPRWFFCVLVLASCDRSSSPNPGASASTGGSVAAPPSAAASVPQGPTQTSLVADANALLARWTDAQNKGDFDAYIALYAPTFEGIRRTAQGTERRMKLTEWRDDRKKIFAHPQKLVLETPTVEVWWKDAVTPKTITVEGTQRWKSGPHADHGKKKLVLERAADGSLRILREEMLSSAFGFDDAKLNVVDAKSLGNNLTVSLAWIATPGCTPTEGSGCHRLQLTVRGGTDKRELPLIDDASDRPIEPGPITPTSQGPLLFEAGWWWAGGGDYFRVVRDAEGIVVKHRVSEEGNAETPGFDEPNVWPDEHRITLAKGAKLVAK